MYFPVGLTEAETKLELEYASGLRHRPLSTAVKLAAVGLVGWLVWRKR